MIIAQIAQHAEDLERATAFYSRLTGLEPAATFDPPGLVFFNLGGVRLLLDKGAPSASSTCRFTTYDEQCRTFETRAC